MRGETPKIQRAAGRARPTKKMQMLDSVRAYEDAVEQAAEISDGAYKVLLYLVRRSLGWRRESVQVTRTEVAIATGKAERSVSRAVAELASSGLVVIDFNGGGNRYTMQISRLKLSKRVRQNAQKSPAEEGASIATSGKADEDSIATSGKAALPHLARVLVKEEVCRKSTRDRTAEESGSDAPDGALVPPGAGDPDRDPVAARAAAAKKTARARTPDRTSKTKTELFRTWVSAHLDVGRRHPMGWGGRANNVGTVVDQFEGGAQELHKFLRWVVENWDGAVRERLRFIKVWPGEPRISLVARFMPDLVEGSLSQPAQTGDGPHSKEIARLNRLGRYEQARELMRRG